MRITRRTLCHSFAAGLASSALSPTNSAAAREASPPAGKLRIYLCLGQSNMVGQAEVEDEDRQIPERLWLLADESRWAAPTHPFNQFSNVENAYDKQTHALHLGLAFGRKMLAARPEEHIGLVCNARGGSSILAWQKGEGKTPTLYDRTLERLQGLDLKTQLAGILWHQGEQDADLGAEYLAYLDRVIVNFRKDLALPKLPFVAGQVARVKDPGPNGSEFLKGEYKHHTAFNPLILKLSSRQPHTAVASTVGCGDVLHFNSPHTRLLGERYAVEMLKLEKAD